RHARAPHLPYTTLFRSEQQEAPFQVQPGLPDPVDYEDRGRHDRNEHGEASQGRHGPQPTPFDRRTPGWCPLEDGYETTRWRRRADRKSTRLNSSHVKIS